MPSVQLVTEAKIAGRGLIPLHTHCGTADRSFCLSNPQLPQVQIGEDHEMPPSWDCCKDDRNQLGGSTSCWCALLWEGPHPHPAWVRLSCQDSMGVRWYLGHWKGRLGPGRLTRAGFLCPQALRDASVLIFANKQDMKDSMTTVEISQFLTLSAIKDHPWHIQGCCALTGEGLVAAPSEPPGPGQTNE